MMENVPYICQFNHTFIPHSSYGKPVLIRVNWEGEAIWISKAKGSSKRKKEHKNAVLVPAHRCAGYLVAVVCRGK
jgi:hypothetical protein